MRFWRATAIAAFLATLAIPTGAALFVVDEPLEGDPNAFENPWDESPGDGICAAAFPVPKCTLRAAVMEANALPGADLILIPDDWRVVLSRGDIHNDDGGHFGDLDIHEDVTIGSFAPPGHWPIVDGGGIDRPFHVHSPAVLTLGNLQVTGGKTYDTTTSEGGSSGVEIEPGAAGEFSNCRFFANQGRLAVVENHGALSMTDCSVDRNRGDQTSTISNYGSMEIVGSAIFDNRDVLQGAFFNAAGGLLTVRNSTITNNTGMGIWSEGDLTLRNVTITDHPDTYGIFVNQPGAFSSPSIRNSIIADNSLLDCVIIIPGGTADINHPNLDSDGSCGFLPAFGGQPFKDPKLGSLQLNGGTTPTMVPEKNSPVIDVGNDLTCESDDQRGAPRPLDGWQIPGTTCDLGAVEVLPCVGYFALSFPAGGWDEPEEYEACYYIDVGPGSQFFPSADITLRTRDAVTFFNDFTLHTGARLQVVLDPAAGSGMTLP